MSWLVNIIYEEAERRRLFPWGVVLFCLGIIVSFNDPPINAGFLALGLLTLTPFILGVYYKDLLLIRLLCWGIAFFCLGFTIAHWRFVFSETPVLTKTLITDIRGTIESVDAQGETARIVVVRLVIDQLESVNTPKKIRLRVKINDPLIPGSLLTAKVRIYPPPKSAVPRGYDFARDAYFKEIGGVGRVLGRYTLATDSNIILWQHRFAVKVDQARNALTQRIADTIGGQAGAVSASLITGKRGLINETTNDILRAAGIYHVVSISGLHMVLAAGIIFWVIRALLALNPYFALMWPIKKIAAGVAMVGAVSYCIFAGAEVATVRSLLMTLVMLGAILVDRPALSIRNVSFAAFFVLLREPEALLGPSFQMSFSAVLALMALSEYLQQRYRQRTVKENILILRIIKGVGKSIFLAVATTLIAGFATAPFAAFHFQVLQNYSVIGNALTLPLISFVVMPCALIGTLLYPIGLDAPVWSVMGVATEQVLNISQWVASLPGAVFTLPQFGVPALFLLVLAILMATLPSFTLRKYAVIPALMGVIIAASPERFDGAIDRDGAGAVIRDAKGKLFVIGKANSFQIEQWLRADGDKRFLLLSNKNVSAEQNGLQAFKSTAQCDKLACIGNGQGIILSVIKHPIAFYEDCDKADIIVSRFYAPKSCKAKVVIDRAFLKKHGATFIFKDKNSPSGFRLETSE